MRNLIIILLLVLINVSCNTNESNKKYINTQDSLNTAPKTLGVGWLEITTAYPIPLYKNLTDSLPYDILKLKIKKPLFKPNDTDQWRVVFQTKINMKPHSIGWNNGHTLIFRVIDFVNNTYRIVSNEETFETCYINIKEYQAYNYNLLINTNPYQFIYKYETWLDYLKRVQFIEKKNIIIYDKPDGEIIFENKKDDFSPFGVVDIDGDWIKLEKLDPYSSRYSNSINYDGWTQWKDGEKLQIQIIEFLYE